MYDIGQTCILPAPFSQTRTPACLLGHNHYFCPYFCFSDGQFPIEISSVTRDHDFLDQDAIEALCR